MNDKNNFDFKQYYEKLPPVEMDFFLLSIQIREKYEYFYVQCDKSTISAHCEFICRRCLNFIKYVFPIPIK